MNAVLTREIEQLSAAERIYLIDDIWASVDSHAGLEAEQFDAMLESRYQDSMANPHQPTQSLKAIAAKHGVHL